MSRFEQQLCVGVIITLVLVGLLGYTVFSEEKRLGDAQRIRAARSIEEGADLYELHCRTCHGSRGEGVGQLGPAFNDRPFFAERLKEVGWQGTLESYVIATSAHGRLMATRPMYVGDGATAVMPPWSKKYGGLLRDDQIRDIAAFILNWKATALKQVELETLIVPATNLNDPQIVARGQTVFKTHCAVCHHIEGVSPETSKGPPLNQIATLALARKAEINAEEYIRESFLIPEAYVVDGFDPKIVGHRCGGQLSVGQLDEVTAFLLTQE